MPLTPIDAVGVTDLSAREPARAVENPGAMLDRDAFLKLLVAQLKYQDPTNPADSSQMLAQSAQLTMVDRLNELTTAYQASAASQRLSLAGTIVGRDVTFLDAEGLRVTATVQTASVENDELTVIAGGYVVPFGAIQSVDAPRPTAPTVVPAQPFASTPPSDPQA